MSKVSRMGAVSAVCFVLSMSVSAFAADSQPEAGGAVPDMPLGQSAEGEVSLLPEDVGVLDEGDLFGVEGGYFHPYITLDI